MYARTTTATSNTCMAGRAKAVRRTSAEQLDKVMRFFPVLKTGCLLAALCWCAYGQGTEIKGLPPRNSATDYQAQAKVGSVTLAAEFAGHSVPTSQGTFSTEDYVTVEMGVFGPPDARGNIIRRRFFAAY